MVRYLLLLVLGWVLYLLVRATVRSFLEALRPTGRGAPHALRDELVRDPVCATYIPRSRAIARTAGSATYYFCSADCAARFVRPS